jgi:hypothetical protein
MGLSQFLGRDSSLDELEVVNDEPAAEKPGTRTDVEPSRRGRDRDEDGEEERPARRRREREEGDERSHRRRRREDEEDEEDTTPRRRGRGWRDAEGKTDTCGVISLIFGIVSVVCLFLGCCTCGFTYYAAVPMAGVGALLGFFGRTNLRVAGLVLNFLALVPAIAFTVLFAAGSGMATIGGLAGKNSTEGAGGGTPAKEYKLGEEIRFGDLGVTVSHAGVAGFTSTTPGGRQGFHEPEFVITIKLKN